MGILDKVFKRKAGSRVFILGLDGTPFGLMQDLFNKGILKNLSAIAGQGGLFKMATSIPEVSSVAWTTFMTGVNPGRHGIFGFTDLKPGTYTNFYPNATKVQSPCIWQLIGKEGKRSIIINMPSTYPAQELNGTLIAGFVAIDLDRATYPKTLVPWLKEIDYQLDVNTALARENTDLFIEDLNKSLEKQEITFRKLMKEEPWDLFAAIVTGTDRLHHFLWDAYEDENSPYHSAFMDYYRAIDDMAGRLYDDLKGDVVFISFSDHGFCSLKRDIYMNRWLEEQGYLSFSGNNRESIADIDPAKTRAFCLDPGRIYINLKRRFPAGSVLPGKSYESLLDELTQAFTGLTAPSGGDAPGKVIQRIFRKEELFQGPFLSSAPDLTLLSHHGNNLKGALGSSQVFDSEGPFTGMHTQDEAFFLANRPVSAPEDLHILDAAKTVMHLLNAGAVDAIEGRPVVSL